MGFHTVSGVVSVKRRWRGRARVRQGGLLYRPPAPQGWVSPLPPLQHLVPCGLAVVRPIAAPSHADSRLAQPHGSSLAACCSSLSRFHARMTTESSRETFCRIERIEWQDLIRMYAKHQTTSAGSTRIEPSENANRLDCFSPMGRRAPQKRMRCAESATQW